MDLRRAAILLVAVTALTGACSEDDEDSAAVSVEDPIGAPEPDSPATGPAAPEATSVVKNAAIEMGPHGTSSARRPSRWWTSRRLPESVGSWWRRSSTPTATAPATCS
ncbi:MAG: hypothetical protein M3323_13790 [Actinomycetota bacterium]|nr:hypothetical protein [Actinomycetota bacterium]